MKEVKLISRKSDPNDFGGGNLDWEVLEGQTTQIEDDNVICQAIKKSTIATRDGDIGYGVGINKLRGTKDVIVFRLMIITRILQTISLLSKWYQTNIEIKSLDIQKLSNSFVFTLKVNQGTVRITV